MYGETFIQDKETIHIIHTRIHPIQELITFLHLEKTNSELKIAT